MELLFQIINEGFVRIDCNLQTLHLLSLTWLSAKIKLLLLKMLLRSTAEKRCVSADDVAGTTLSPHYKLFCKENYK